MPIYIHISQSDSVNISHKIEYKVAFAGTVVGALTLLTFVFVTASVGTFGIAAAGLMWWLQKSGKPPIESRVLFQFLDKFHSN